MELGEAAPRGGGQGGSGPRQEAERQVSRSSSVALTGPVVSDRLPSSPLVQHLGSCIFCPTVQPAPHGQGLPILLPIGATCETFGGE